jgi:hypothetical protein
LPGRFAEVIEIRPRTARVLGCYGVLLWLLTAGAVQLAVLPHAAQVLLLICVAAMLLNDIRRYAPGGSRWISCSTLMPDGSWRIELRNGLVHAAHLQRSWGERTGLLMMMEWRCVNGEVHRAWLALCQVNPDLWRRLRVRLTLA